MALLAEPSPRERQHILISVDDHVIEPPDMFDGRQVWRYEDREYPNIGLNAVIGGRRRNAPLPVEFTAEAYVG
jgi:hypothetical protein